MTRREGFSYIPNTLTILANLIILFRLEPDLQRNRYRIHRVLRTLQRQQVLDLGYQFTLTPIQKRWISDQLSYDLMLLSADVHSWAGRNRLHSSLLRRLRKWRKKHPRS